MVLRLNDKISLDWETAKQRLREAAKNDPYDVMLKHFQKAHYHAIMNILLDQPEPNPRRKLAVPTVLLHVTAEQRAKFLKYAKDCGVQDEALRCLQVAARLASEYHRDADGLESILNGTPKSEALPGINYQAFMKFYNTYKDHAGRSTGD